MLFFCHEDVLQKLSAPWQIALIPRHYHVDTSRGLKAPAVIQRVLHEACYWQRFADERVAHIANLPHTGRMLAAQDDVHLSKVHEASIHMLALAIYNTGMNVLESTFTGDWLAGVTTGRGI